MYPHQNNIRERRGGQPPMAPHLMGMPQQGPGVIMSMPNQPVQIMQNHHYTNQNSYSTQGQTNVSSFMTQQQGPPQQSSYSQSNYSGPQVVLSKQAVNRSKNYRKEYNVVKESMNFNSNDQKNHNNFGSNEYNPGTFGSYNQSSYNGQHFQPQSQPQEIVHDSTGNNGDISSTIKEKDENVKEDISKNAENKQDCPPIKQNILPNVKEKTPMCLVNELARFNKITHQYRLTNEQGPAHKKSFTVTLKLDNEEYTAEGTSIKKAQHSAAAEALSKTSFPHPTPKANKNLHSGKLNVTPTVELNGLAMKRGEPAVYQLIQAPQSHLMQAQSPYYRRPYPRTGSRVPMEPVLPQNANYKVSLKVGMWEFFGEGPSPQTARHDAASKALSQLKKLPVPEDDSTNALQKENVLTSTNDQDYESLIKSPISLVHEIALKRNMNVLFEVISEKGPAHMKTFVTKCMVGDLTATGEGNAKKVSKKRAAENMLLELKKLPPLSPSLAMGNMGISRMKKKPTQVKKKSRNLIKIVQERKTEPDCGEEINPISRLMQIQQMKKEKEPVYTLVEEKGMPRRREFIIEVAVGQLKAAGSGPNKKLAKKLAAQNLLAVMGYAKHEGNATKLNMKSQDGAQDLNKDRKVTFMDSEKPSDGTGGSLGRQLKPGIYVMSGDQHSSSVNTVSSPISLQTTATIAKELLKGGNSPTADALVQKATVSKSSNSQSVAHAFRPKDQLLYLADLLNFQVQFSNFPKGNHSEFLSLVTMSTNPSHVCHGSGPTIEESQDQAALTALRALSEMGVDSVTPQNPSKEIKKNVKCAATLTK
ncbi:UNVERIFIED_CONTAM: hypothetical protein PYX00_010660 [Menopon gallinae]|uniref:DRBM domain-containing protein n=1 Tax=Menopon gallinae TaxID=328185 RepID=A0AAW2HGK3_9NEOP